MNTTEIIITQGSSRIRIEEFEGEFEYEVQVENYYRRGDWHTMHSDEGFKSVEEARDAAIKWMDNYEPSDEQIYSREGMSHREQMSNYQRLK